MDESVLANGVSCGLMLGWVGGGEATLEGGLAWVA